MITEEEVKTCEHCGQALVRRGRMSDFVWDQKRYCDETCKAAARRARMRRPPKINDGYHWLTMEPPDYIVAEIEQRTREVRARGVLAGLFGVSQELV